MCHCFEVIKWIPVNQLYTIKRRLTSMLGNTYPSAHCGRDGFSKFEPGWTRSKSDRSGHQAKAVLYVGAASRDSDSEKYSWHDVPTVIKIIYYAFTIKSKRTARQCTTKALTVYHQGRPSSDAPDQVLGVADVQTLVRGLHAVYKE